MDDFTEKAYGAARAYYEAPIWASFKRARGRERESDKACIKARGRMRDYLGHFFDRDEAKRIENFLWLNPCCMTVTEFCEEFEEALKMHCEGKKTFLDAFGDLYQSKAAKSEIAETLKAIDENKEIKK